MRNETRFSSNRGLNRALGGNGRGRRAGWMVISGLCSIVVGGEGCAESGPTRGLGGVEEGIPEPASTSEASLEERAGAPWKCRPDLWHRMTF